MKKFIGIKSRLAAGIILLLSVFVISNSCNKENTYGNSGGDGSKGPGANEVFIQNMAFKPGTITVTVNTTINWTNKDGLDHTVTSNTGLFDSGIMKSNGTYSYKFTSAGTYSYHCTIHPTMTGTVQVNIIPGY
jgi:plastocyanin